ncbi:MAG: hypothetical protein L3J49_11460, partial [Desulfobulbaceae bacterium]|nr:hypothetical protein [Desulfobulbaceae bacterium]
MFSGQRRIFIDSVNLHFLTKLRVTASMNNENQPQLSSVGADFFPIGRAILLTLVLVTYSLFALFPSAALAEPPVADA